MLFLNHLDLFSYYSDILTCIITFIVLIYASFTDLKEGIVPNKIMILFTIFGIILNIFKLLIFKNINYFLIAFSIAFLTFIVSYILWLLNLWGGGDVKLFTGLSLWIPFPVFHSILLNNITYNSFYLNPSNLATSFSIFINSIILSFIFLISSKIYIIIKNKELFHDFFNELFSRGFLERSFLFSSSVLIVIFLRENFIYILSFLDSTSIISIVLILTMVLTLVFYLLLSKFPLFHVIILDLILMVYFLLYNFSLFSKTLIKILFIVFILNSLILSLKSMIKPEKTKTIPFVPFILLGYLVLILFGNLLTLTIIFI